MELEPVLKGLIVGVANEKSLAAGCAEVLANRKVRLALTYQNEKSRPFVVPVADIIQPDIFMPMDVTDPEQERALFSAIKDHWGKLDFLIHSIAFAPKADLQGRVTDSSREGFMTAMDISCHSLVRLARAAEPLMTDGGSILTMSYYGGEKVIPNYGIMGPVKAALESTVRYLAYELGPKNIRVNALSPGPVKTRAATGLTHFDHLMEMAAAQAPLRQVLTVEEVGETAAFLVSEGARHITGQVIYVDNGFNIHS